MAETQESSAPAQILESESAPSGAEPSSPAQPTAGDAAVGLAERAEPEAPAAPVNETTLPTTAPRKVYVPELESLPVSAIEPTPDLKEAPAPTPSNLDDPPTAPPVRAPAPLATGTPAAPSVASTFKRFSSSSANINKKFLQSTTTASASSASTASQGAKSTPTTNAATATVRPQVAPQPPLSRLISTKLTTAPQAASTAGWLKSATPSASSTQPPSPANANANAALRNPAPPNAASTPTSTSAGGVRSPGANAAAQLNSSGRVWGRVSSTAASVPNLKAKNDFPTAAEAAQTLLAKTAEHHPPLSEKPAVSSITEAQKQALSQTADAFRGVHLDPNAHHWDDIEDEDVDYLGGVIEFGDGTQYNVQQSQSKTPRSSTPDVPPSQTASVSKADRFEDDFDRNWPRSTRPPTPSASLFHPHPPPTTIQAPTAAEVPPGPPARPRLAPGDNRALFNERSNRLEPYAPPSSASTPNNSGPPPRSIETRPNAFSPRDRQVELPRKEPLTSLPASASAPVGLGPPSSRSDTSRRWEVNSPPPPLGPPASSVTRERSRGGRPRGDAAVLKENPTPRVPVTALPTSPRAAPSESALSPTLSATAPSAIPLSPTPASAPSSSLPPPAPVPVMDLQEFTKSTLHDGAERARKRRQEEEEQRELERERARQKARALEEVFKAAEAKKEAEKAEKEVKEVKKEQVGVVEFPRQRVPSESERPFAREGTWPRRPSQASTVAPPPPSSEPPRDIAMQGVRRPSITGVPTGPRRTSNAMPPPPPPSALQADSWRSKAAPPTAPTLPPLPPSTVLPPQSSHISGSVQEVTSLSLKPGEDLEIVNFDELGAFMDDAPPPPPPAPAPAPAPVVAIPTSPPITIPAKELQTPSRRPARPVASDFFDEPPSVLVEPQVAPPRARTPVPLETPPPLKSDLGQWRRPTSHAGIHRPGPSSEKSPPLPDTTTPTSLDPSAEPLLSSTVFRRIPSSSSYARSNGPPSPTLTKNLFREAPMSTLDDTMSRIRGALDHMQSHDVGIVPNLQSPIHVKRRLSDAVGPHDPFSSSSSTMLPRTRSLGGPMPFRDSIPHHHRPRTRTIIEEDLFDVTRTPPPAAHPPHGNAGLIKPIVRLPGSVRPKEPVPSRQLGMFRLPPRPMRWEILSWEPPVEGMSRKTLSRDEVLFEVCLGGAAVAGSADRRPEVIVSLSKSSIVATSTQQEHYSGSFGEPSRSELDTMSRSPLPESATQTIVSLPGSRSRAGSTQATASPRSSSSVLARSQPKMPTGSDVAFYRTVGDASASVKFTVSSELDGASPESDGVAAVDTESTKRPGELASPSPTSSLLTPPPVHASTTSWAKSPLGFPVIDSPSRGAPDSDHLKTVWSQAAQDSNNQENSLKGIADDFSTSIPFALHEIKSEDGDPPKPDKATTTPPMSTPHTSASRPASVTRTPSHDAHRLFQQVPPTPITSRTPAYSAPQPYPSTPFTSSMSAPALRGPTGPPAHPSSHAHASTLHQTPPHQRYPTYHAPPSPAMMYAAPPPNVYPVSPAMSHRPLMNGPPPGNPPPVWIQHGQQPGTFRPTGAPSYPHPMMSYPTPPPSSMPNLYQAAQGVHKPGAPPATPGSIGRGRGVHPGPGPMVSPVPAHAQAPGLGMYGRGMMDQSPHGAYVVSQQNLGMAQPQHHGYPHAPHAHAPGGMYNVPHGPAGRGADPRNGFDNSPQHPHQHNPGNMYASSVGHTNFRPW